MTDQIVKVCKVHGELKEEQIRISKYFRSDRNKFCIRYICIICSREYDKIRCRKRYAIKGSDYLKRKNNPKQYEKIKANRRKYYENHKSIAIKQSKEWKINNPDKVKINNYKCNKKMVKDLNERYIKHIICINSDIQRKNIPIGLIELVKTNLLLKRKLKNRRKQNV